MTEILLAALEGTNPIGFMAALGVLDAAARADYHVTLRWTDDLVPQPLLAGIEDANRLLDVLEADRRSWAQSLVLRYPEDKPFSDAKPDNEALRAWFEAAFASGCDTDAAMLCSIVAEGAFDRGMKAKPTHLHFTAGQQQFLEMVRTLAAEVDKDMFIEGIFGPWQYKSTLPSLSWDARGERVYAVRAINPSSEKRLGVPGADWLAFRGLVFYPVSAVGGTLRTTACDREWKQSALRWPLWSVPASPDVVRSLVGDPSLVSARWVRGPERITRPRDLAARGILRIVESPIRRSDQGGYGSFGAASTLMSASPEHAGDRD